MLFTSYNKSGEAGDAPKAYLNYLVFNKNFELILSRSGYQRMSTAAREDGLLAPQGVAHQLLQSYDIPITEPGYVYIYLSNEEAGKEVYFDDFTVEHVKSPIIQTDEYYPFGLTFNSYRRENSMAQDLKYNGKETQTELDLQLLDYGARMYQPDLGRFLGIDSKSEGYFNVSPYTYVSNSPVNNLDIDGDFILPQKYFSKYERLTQYLQYGIQGILSNDKIVNALKQYGGFSDSQLKSTFAWGNGPKVVVGEFRAGKGVVSDFYGKKGKQGLITLNKIYVDKLESAVGEERDYYLFLIAVGILHETTHYCREENYTMEENIAYDGEEGFDFEMAAYGKYIGPSNVSQHMRAWLDKQKKQDENSDSETSNKRQALTKFISNAGSLAAGTYRWNGTGFVKDEK